MRHNMTILLYHMISYDIIMTWNIALYHIMYVSYDKGTSDVLHHMISYDIIWYIYDVSYDIIWYHMMYYYCYIIWYKHHMIEVPRGSITSYYITGNLQMHPGVLWSGTYDCTSADDCVAANVYPATRAAAQSPSDGARKWRRAQLAPAPRKE